MAVSWVGGWVVVSVDALAAVMVGQLDEQMVGVLVGMLVVEMADETVESWAEN